MPLPTRGHEDGNGPGAAQLPTQFVDHRGKGRAVLVDGKHVVPDLDGEGSVPPKGDTERQPAAPAVVSIDEDRPGARHRDDQRECHPQASRTCERAVIRGEDGLGQVGPAALDSLQRRYAVALEDHFTVSMKLAGRPLDRPGPWGSAPAGRA